MTVHRNEMAAEAQHQIEETEGKFEAEKIWNGTNCPKKTNVF